MIDREFWRGRRVFITGHTGFKGSWLCLWLHSLGAEITGYALNPPTSPSLFELCRIGRFMKKSVVADVRDIKTLHQEMAAASPTIVIHMAAQPLVRASYNTPVETYSTNIMGTVNLFEAVRACSTVKAVINVTSDKCYENKESMSAYREDNPLGGYDPYSSSKACAELVTSAYRNSYFHPNDYAAHGIGVASARAGNVIGGGDWAADRLIPDCVRAILKGEKVLIRNPHAIRPWQHVLEPLSGYLILAQKLYEDGPGYAEAWNFGPEENDMKPVSWLVDKLCTKWGDGASYTVDQGAHLHEAQCLKLDCSKAKAMLGWRPVWDLEKAIDNVIEWTKAFKEKRDVVAVCIRQIEAYSAEAAAKK